MGAKWRKSWDNIFLWSLGEWEESTHFTKKIKISKTLPKNHKSLNSKFVDHDWSVTTKILIKTDTFKCVYKLLSKINWVEVGPLRFQGRDSALHGEGEELLHHEPGVLLFIFLYILVWVITLQIKPS